MSKTGTASTTHKTPARRKREADKRRAEERRWANKAGPVTTRFICPICGQGHSRQHHDDM